MMYDGEYDQPGHEVAAPRYGRSANPHLLAWNEARAKAADELGIPNGVPRAGTEHYERAMDIYRGSGMYRSSGMYRGKKTNKEKKSKTGKKTKKKTKKSTSRKKSSGKYRNAQMQTVAAYIRAMQEQ